MALIASRPACEAHLGGAGMRLQAFAIGQFGGDRAQHLRAALR